MLHIGVSTLRWRRKYKGGDHHEQASLWIHACLDAGAERGSSAAGHAGIRRPGGEPVFDKQSGKDFERPGYQELLKTLQSGDTLVIKSIDRLGRNYDEILEQWRLLTKEKQVWISVLDMPMLDTCADRDLLGRLIAEIMLQVLSYVAQQERDFIRQRQKEGIEAAKLRGVQFGQKELPIPDQYHEVRNQWASGCLSANAAAKRLGVARNTFLKWARAEV